MALGRRKWGLVATGSVLLAAGVALAATFGVPGDEGKPRVDTRVANTLVSQCGSAPNPTQCLERLYAAQARIDEEAAAKGDLAAREKAAALRAAREKAEREKRARETPAETAAREAATQKAYDDLMKAEAIRTAAPKAYPCSCNGMAIEGPFNENDPLASCRRQAFQMPAFKEKVLFSGVCPRTYNNTATFELKCTMGPSDKPVTTFASCDASLYRVSPGALTNVPKTGGAKWYKP